MTIPIIILNYNSSTDCSKCISFLKQQKEVEVEIVVVDNCSREDDVKTLRKLCSKQQCTLIENHENRGYNAGNNIGLRYAAQKGYKYALIANPDMEFPQKDYLAKMVAKLEEDEEIVACGSDIVNSEGLHQNPLNYVSFWNELLWPFEMLKFVCSQKALSTVMNHQNSFYCPVLSGCCLLVRIGFIKQISFLDEHVFLYCEESILAHQVKVAGMKLYYMSDVSAIHRHIKSQKGNPYRRLMLLCDSRDYKNRYHSDYNFVQLQLLLLSSKLRKWILKIKS